MKNKKNQIAIIVVAALLLGLVVSMKLAGQRQDIRNRAAVPGGTGIELKLEDPNALQSNGPISFNVNGEKTLNLKASFTGGSELERLGYFKTEINFDKNYINVPISNTQAAAYINTSSSQLNAVQRISTSTEANTAGKIVIELGADDKATGPRTSGDIVVATIRFKGIQSSGSEALGFSFTNTEVTNNNVNPTELNTQTPSVSYGVAGDAAATATPTAGTVLTATPTVPNATPIPGSSRVNLILKPERSDIHIGTIQDFMLVAQVENGSATKKLGYFKTELTFPKTYLEIPSTNPYISTVDSGFNSIFRVDSNIAANQNGKIVIELGADQPGNGPATDKDITIAKFKMKGILVTPSTQEFSIGTTEMVWYLNGQAQALNINPQSSFFNVTGDVVPTNTPRPNDPTPTLYQPTVRPTPPSDRDQYIIDIGDKQSLTIEIGKGTGTGVQIKFKAKLADVQGHPDLLLRLRVKDELAFLNNPGDAVSSGNTCKNPPASEKDFWIPVKAGDNGIYFPDNNAVPYANANTKTRKSNQESARATDVATAPVSADGWVTLDGLYNDRYYSLFLKGPKTKATRTAEHIIWQGGQRTLPEFDWTSKELALQPGDLMDPNSNYEQNCTVNSIDLALIEARLAKTDADSLKVADVNYDGVVNGNDISKVVHTLSTKPDDDH